MAVTTINGVYVSVNSFTVTGDQTDNFETDRRTYMDCGVDGIKYEVYVGQGIEEVDAVGGACVMVKRRLYEAIERPYEFEYHRDGTLALTCDFVIWQKAQKAGFKLFVDFSILCDHQRICSVKGIQDTLHNLAV